MYIWWWAHKWNPQYCLVNPFSLTMIIQVHFVSKSHETILEEFYQCRNGWMSFTKTRIWLFWLRLLSSKNTMGDDKSMRCPLEYVKLLGHPAIVINLVDLALDHWQIFGWCGGMIVASLEVSLLADVTDCVARERAMIGVSLHACNMWLPYHSHG